MICLSEDVDLEYLSAKVAVCAPAVIIVVFLIVLVTDPLVLPPRFISVARRTVCHRSKKKSAQISKPKLPLNITRRCCSGSGAS